MIIRLQKFTDNVYLPKKKCFFSIDPEHFVYWNRIRQNSSLLIILDKIIGEIVKNFKYNRCLLWQLYFLRFSMEIDTRFRL